MQKADGKQRKERRAEIVADLLRQPFESFIERLFGYFPIDCFSLQSLDVVVLEKQILALGEIEDAREKEKIILQIIEQITSVHGGGGELLPITEKAVEEIEKWIAEHFPAEGALAEIVGVKKAKLYYISQQLKKNFGKTLTQYKMDVQIEKAKAKLLTKDTKITYIAMECGFCTSSYFCEIFKKKVGVTPKEYRRIMMQERELNFMANATDADKILFDKLEYIPLTADEVVKGAEKSSHVQTYCVSTPDAEFSFLHEGAVIVFKGKIFAAWYNNERLELTGRTPIRFSTSVDGGKTWSTPKIIADDVSGEILYCPPVFGIQDGKLYLFLNQMVQADRIRSLDLYRFHEEKESFERLWTRPIPFKLNTNVYTLPSGKLMLVGRMGELDCLPEIPAVMISDSGEMEGEWRVVPMQANNLLPDGEKFIFPETSAILDGGKIYVFCRNDRRCVPILYISEDEGETWSGPYAHNIPFLDSKIYSGTLADGHHYAIGNIVHKRERLAIFFSEKNRMYFDRAILLQDKFSEELQLGTYWHYPCAYESEGKLYVVYTVTYDETNLKRGLVISVLDLAKIE